MRVWQLFVPNLFCYFWTGTNRNMYESQADKVSRTRSWFMLKGSRSGRPSPNSASSSTSHSSAAKVELIIWPRKMLPSGNRNFKDPHLRVATFLAFAGGNYQRICKEQKTIPSLSSIEGQTIRIMASGMLSVVRLKMSQTCAKVAKWLYLLDICVYAAWSFAEYQELTWLHGRVFITATAREAVYLYAQFSDVVTHFRGTSTPIVKTMQEHA